MTKLTALLIGTTLALGISNAYTLALLRERASLGTECPQDSDDGRQLEQLPAVSPSKPDPSQLEQRAAVGPVESSSHASPTGMPQNDSALLAALANLRRAPPLSLEQREIMARGRFGGVVRELNLSDEQVKTLLRVLAVQDARAAETARTRVDAAGEEPRASKRRELEQAEIAAVIGWENASRFEKLKEGLPTRTELRRLRDELEDVGEPLSGSQYAALVSAAKSRPPTPPPARVPGESPEVAIERMRTWFAERDQRILDDAAAVLTPEQLQRIEERQSVSRSLSTPSSLVVSATNERAGAGSGG